MAEKPLTTILPPNCSLPSSVDKSSIPENDTTLLDSSHRGNCEQSCQEHLQTVMTSTAKPTQHQKHSTLKNNILLNCLPSVSLSAIAICLLYFNCSYLFLHIRYYLYYEVYKLYLDNQIPVFYFTNTSQVNSSVSAINPFFFHAWTINSQKKYECSSYSECD